jgi:hypothetical protein
MNMKDEMLEAVIYRLALECFDQRLYDNRSVGTILFAICGSLRHYRIQVLADVVADHTKSENTWLERQKKAL